MKFCFDNINCSKQLINFINNALVNSKTDNEKVNKLTF
jgi:hypothetical protein